MLKSLRVDMWMLLAALSAGMAATAAPPSAPVMVGASPGNAMAVVSFTAPAQNGGAPISGYTATCSTGAAGAPAIGGHGIGLDFLGTSSAAVTTGAFNTVSGSIVLASVGRGGLADFASATVSDNKGNGNFVQQGTAHPYTLYASSGTALYARLNAAGGSGHTVSTTKPDATDEVTLIAGEFRNVDTIVDIKWVEDRTSPNTSASVTTTGPAILAAYWWGDNALGELNPAVDAGWTVLDHTSSLASNHVQSASAYRVVNAAGTYAINWTPSTAQGAQLWIVAMQQSAGGTAVSASGLSSPIIVKGLVNGATYQCVVTAANSAGTGAASAAATVTPSAAAPFALAAVQSRKTHGAAGIFDLGIATQPVNGQVTVEPRQPGPGHSLVFQFNGPVSAAGSATLSPSGSASTTGTGNEVLVNLNGVVDNQRTTVTLSGVNNGFNPAPVTLGFLLGDVNNSRSVLASDISVVKSRAGQTTNGANFRFDLDLSGTVDALDTGKVKAGSGLVLP